MIVIPIEMTSRIQGRVMVLMPFLTCASSCVVCFYSHKIELYQLNPTNDWTELSQMCVMQSWNSDKTTDMLPLFSKPE